MIDRTPSAKEESAKEGLLQQDRSKSGGRIAIYSILEPGGHVTLMYKCFVLENMTDIGHGMHISGLAM